MKNVMESIGGATPLMYACQQCRETDVLEILRRQPYSVKERDRTLKTPLHYCAENPNSSCAEAVLKIAPELVNSQDENGYCTLHLAVIAGNKPLIKLLIAKGADVNIHDNEGHSAVHWAIVSSEKEALEMIIRAGANPSTPDIHGGYPLHYAVQMCGCQCEYVRNFEDTVRVVEALLNFGVDVSVKDKDGRQPILWAASAGSADAIVHLVSAGACVEAADKDGLTALHCAASRGHTTALETLITLCGANVDVIDGNGCSALFYSVTLGHADATELLLKLGAEPNRQDRKGRTPAHCGAAKGQLETLRILQKHGGNLWMRNVKGDIPLHEAVASGRKDLVLWLLSQCSEAINIANNDGRCPLHIASMYNNTEMVKVLLDCKSLVNPVMRTSKGILMTPLNVALSKGHRSCGKYLQLHGGVPFSKVSKVEPASGFAVRVSPSDDAVVILSENNKENLSPSQITTISKSRSSTDIQENRESSKGESTDKKKVYRRRKKKKNQSSMQTQDSDSDDSVHDLKVKTSDSRKSEKSDDGGSNESKKPSKVQLETKRTGKDGSKTVERQLEAAEESITVTKVTKSRTETLQRNKSFNETKNVSDLSPEDFPPLMQTINHLDIVIMEPDLDASKSESENVEVKQQDAVETTVEGGTTSAVSDAASAENVQTEEDVIEVKTPESRKSEKSAEEEEKVGKEESPLQEKSEKGSGGKKLNGGTRKDEGRKSVKSPKSSSDGGSGKKDSKPGRKSNGSSDSSGRGRKATSPKESKTADRTEGKTSGTTVTEETEKTVSLETKTDEIQQQEEDTIVVEASTETSKPDLEEVTKTETETVAEEKTPESNVESVIEVAETSEAVVVEAATLSPEKEETKPSESPVENVTIEEVPVVVTVEAEVNAPGEPEAGEKMTPDDVIQSETVDKPEEMKEEPVETLPEITIIHNTPEKKKPDDEETKPITVLDEPVSEPLPHAIEKRSVEFIEPAKPEEEDKQTVAEHNSNEDFIYVDDGNSEDTIHVDIVNSKDQSDADDKDPPNGNGSNKEEKATPEQEDQNEEGKTHDGSPWKRTSEERQFRTPRVSRLCRRNREFRDDMNQISVTQLVQNTIRKYHMERGIFYQLLELKRYQIRSGRANEQVLVKRLADEYERSRVFLGMKPFTGVYKFREFEKFLYDQLKALNSRRSYIIPEVKSYDDIDALSGFLKKSRYKILSETPPPEMVCTCITQRCHHSACAYTNVPCSAYITDLRRHRHHRPRRESFFPRIETKSENQKYKERPATLELIQGSEKHVITLPQSSPAGDKRYYVTFTIKGAPAFKGEEDVSDESKDYLKHRHAKSV